MIYLLIGLNNPIQTDPSPAVVKPKASYGFRVVAMFLVYILQKKKETNIKIFHIFRRSIVTQNFRNPILIGTNMEASYAYTQ
jgi:hypothetical protein